MDAAGEAYQILGRTGNSRRFYESNNLCGASAGCSRSIHGQ